VRQLATLSGHSPSKIKRIIRLWLGRCPPQEADIADSKYLLYDGTYFHKEGCLISLMDAQSQETIAHIWAEGEGYETAREWFRRLREKGLYPLYITMDGERFVMRAIAEIWPEAKIQRCDGRQAFFRFLLPHPRMLPMEERLVEAQWGHSNGQTRLIDI